MRILVVDDDPVFREELTDLLRSEGHDVGAAPSVQKAEESLEGSEFDVVLTDLKMPRRGGMDLLRTVRGRWPRTMVVVVTGYASVDTALEAMKLGAFDYVRKPFRLDQIQETLRLAVQQREFEAPQGAERDPIREAKALAAGGRYEVLYVGDRAPGATPHLTVMPMGSMEPDGLRTLVDSFVDEHAQAAVVLESVDRWVASHRLEEVVAVLDGLRARLDGHGPLRVGFSPGRLSASAATAVGGAVAAEETHATLEALANPIRRRILLRLSDGPASFGEAMRATGLDDSPKISFHLRKLAETGLVVHASEEYSLSARGKASVRLLADATFLPTADDGGNVAHPTPPGRPGSARRGAG